MFFTIHVNGSREDFPYTATRIMEEMRKAKFHNSHPHGTKAPRGPGPPHYRCCTITLRHTIFDRTPLDEGSLPRTDVYLPTHNTHHRHTCMPPAGFEYTIPADLRLRPHGHRDRLNTLVRVKIVTGVKNKVLHFSEIKKWQEDKEEDVGSYWMTLTHWGRGHLNCLNARSRGF